jgi:DNA-3-methyladenine glycosylase II
MGASVALFQYGQAEIDHLTRRDRKLGRAIGRIGMIERPVMPDLFKALVHSIVAQQISRKAANTVWGRRNTPIGSFTFVAFFAMINLLGLRLVQTRSD